MSTTETTTPEQITLATIRQHAERMLALGAASGVKYERQSHAAGYDHACRDFLAILDMNDRPAHEPVVFSPVRDVDPLSGKRARDTGLIGETDR